MTVNIPLALLLGIEAIAVFGIIRGIVRDLVSEDYITLVIDCITLAVLIFVGVGLYGKAS